MTTPSSQPPSPFPSSPRTTISDGIDQNSIPKVRHGLDLFAHSRRGLDSFGLDWALSLAVKRARPDIVRYLLDETDVKVDGLSPLKVGIAARDPGIEVGKVEEVLKVLVERGWDVNGMEASGPLVSLPRRPRLLPDSHPNLNPPLSEVVAKQGTVNTLRLLLEHGAGLGRRTLHRAVESAAYADPERRAQRMEMVSFLVEELGVDVDGMDVPEGEKRPNHWGTPMAYAVPAKTGDGDGGEEVVRFLLERGADAGIMDCWGQYNVCSLADRLKNERVVGVLRDWKAQKSTVKA